MTVPSAVVFDIGNVLIGWDPRNLYRKLFGGRESEMEWFLENVCNNEWNIEQDRGRSFADGVKLLTQSHPAALHVMIHAYHERWSEMLSGEIAESVAILRALHAKSTPVYAITNWNQDKFRHARTLYPFLDMFRGIIVSGDEGLLKPSAEIFELFLHRYGLEARHCVFIDDSEKNVHGAREAGLGALHFTSPENLARDLRALGLNF
ncbi:HAD family phosphatase [soil metagenome]